MPARSLLMRALLRLSREIRREAGAPPSMTPPPRVSQGPRPSRRAVLLAGAGALGSLVACGAAPARLARPGAGSSVVIVGAGIAGLVCAHRLGQLGVHATIHEASARVGGRMLTDRKTFAGPLGEGPVADHGGELVDTGHRTIQGLCQEFGLALDDVASASRHLKPIYWLGGREVPERDLVESLRPVVATMTREMSAISSAGTPSQKAALLRERDSQSIERWLADNRVESPALDLLRVAFTTELGLDPDVLSCVPMLQMLSVEGDELRLYGESDESYRIRGGSDRLPAAIARRLGEDRIRTQSRLEALSRLSDGRLLLSLSSAGRPIEIKADHVILAIPFSVLRGVRIHDSVGLSARKRRSIAELGYGTNAKLLLGFRARSWKDRGLSGEIFTTLPIQSTWDQSRGQPSSAGLLTNYTGGARGLALCAGSVAERHREAIADLDAILPGLGGIAGRCARAAWPTHELFRGSYSAWLVGQMSGFGGVEGEPEGGNLHFAGEHTSREFNGYMEGGAESGERAAREVAAALSPG